MNAREFFYLTSNVRKTQDEYFRTKDQKVLRAARALEVELDREIERVKQLEEGNKDYDFQNRI